MAERGRPSLERGEKPEGCRFRKAMQRCSIGLSSGGVRLGELGLVGEGEAGEGGVGDKDGEDEDEIKGGDEDGKGSNKKKSSSTVCAITLKHSRGSDGGGESGNEEPVTRLWKVFVFVVGSSEPEREPDPEPEPEPKPEPEPPTTRNNPGYLTGKYSPNR